MPINAEMMEKRTKESAHRPKFIRPESWRYDRLRTTWRKPKGIDPIFTNHQRKLEKPWTGLMNFGRWADSFVLFSIISALIGMIGLLEFWNK